MLPLLAEPEKVVLALLGQVRAGVVDVHLRKRRGANIGHREHAVAAEGWLRTFPPYSTSLRQLRLQTFILKDMNTDEPRVRRHRRSAVIPA